MECGIAARFDEAERPLLRRLALAVVRDENPKPMQQVNICVPDTIRRTGVSVARHDFKFE